MLKFEGVAISYLTLCSGNRLWPLFSLKIFGTIDQYLQGPCLSQQTSQILRESVFFLTLAVTKLIFRLLIRFWAACTPTYAS